jgi:hypothetical protein
MKPFRSPQEMLDAHEAMFGEAGRRAAEIVLNLAPRLFAVLLDPLSVRVVLAPFQLSGYNRSGGYCLGVGDQHLILGNRHKCAVCSDKIALTKNFADFICHELTHIRQDQLLREHAGEWGWAQSGSNVHRDKGWYQAISEAAPNYLGVEIPAEIWPKRNNPDTLTEPEMCHWPTSIRDLVKDKDPRLPKPAKAA